jgi:hypothetical protein
MGVVSGFLAAVLMMCGPHVKQVDPNGRIKFLRILQEVRPVCKNSQPVLSTKYLWDSDEPNGERNGEKEGLAIKNPLPVRSLRRGCPHTRRIGATNPHGALSSREAYPSQRSSQKDCCHRDIPAINYGPSDPLVCNIVSSPRVLSRGSPHASATTGPIPLPASRGILPSLSPLVGWLEIFVGSTPAEQGSA